MTDDTDELTEEPTAEPTAIKDAIKNEREKCIHEIELFARDYVAKWERHFEYDIKAGGWAILQAAEHLRYMGKKL